MSEVLIQCHCKKPDKDGDQSVIAIITDDGPHCNNCGQATVIPTMTWLDYKAFLGRDIDMRTITYSEEWDKLKTEVFVKGFLFTTARAYTARSDGWYKSGRGELFHQVLQRGTPSSWEDLGAARLLSIHYKWAREFKIEEIQADTYLDWDREKWEDLMMKFYRLKDPFLIVLNFELEEVFEHDKNIKMRGRKH